MAKYAADYTQTFKTGTFRPKKYTQNWQFIQRQEAVSRVEWHDLFWLVHSVCLWDDKGPPKVYSALREDILEFIKQAQERVLSHQEEQALLKAYIAEWRKFFTQCNYLPMPFGQLETALQGKTSGPVSKKTSNDESVVRKLMLDSWNQSIFSNIKQRLQDSAMKLVHAERTGEAFDSQLVSSSGLSWSYLEYLGDRRERVLCELVFEHGGQTAGLTRLKSFDKN